MKNTRHILIFLFVLILTLSKSTSAQIVRGDWQSVQSLTLNTALIVETKNSQTIRGYLDGVSATSLSLTTDPGKGAVSFSLDDVRKVFLAKKGSRGRAIKNGAAIGAAVGLGLTLAVLSKSRSSGDPPTYGIVFPILGAGGGAAVGAATSGNKFRKGQLIYEST